MAEATALALATTITDCLGLQQVFFLSDNQQLVHFLNGPDQADPPDWRIKYFTQTFTNFTSTTASRVLKIQRADNCTADALARQGFLQSQSSSPTALTCTCSNAAAHVQCSLQEALLSITLNFVSLLTAVCC